MPKILITTVPFGIQNSHPIELLNNAGYEYVINPLGRKLKEDELAEMVGDFDVLIAGTEPITKKVLENAHKLRFISRVGIGLDSVDLPFAQNKGIQVSYTPDAPAAAVAELAICSILSLLRGTHIANSKMHRGEWVRYFGRRISEVTIGVIGVGRIGGIVVDGLKGLGAKKILMNDIYSDSENSHKLIADGISWASKEEIIKGADLITLHVPLTALTSNMISRVQIMQMKKGVLIVNTARGGIVNELDLAASLNEGYVGGAAIDVFEEEPYLGPLSKLENCMLTAHMGSMSIDCRARMEIEATEEAIRFLRGEVLRGQVPIDEYENQRRGL